MLSLRGEKKPERNSRKRYTLFCRLLRSVKLASLKRKAAETTTETSSGRSRSRQVSICAQTLAMFPVANSVEALTSRDSQTPWPHWINATLAMFRPLPWPSLTEVSRTRSPRTGVLYLKCALMSICRHILPPIMLANA